MPGWVRPRYCGTVMKTKKNDIDAVAGTAAATVISR
jgi:hypothetical protein